VGGGAGAAVARAGRLPRPLGRGEAAVGQAPVRVGRRGRPGPGDGRPRNVQHAVAAALGEARGVPRDRSGRVVRPRARPTPARRGPTGASRPAWRGAAMSPAAGPAAGGGRWVDINAERLQCFLDGFGERHGEGSVTATPEQGHLTAADGAPAEWELPSPPLAVDGSAAYAG